MISHASSNCRFRIDSSDRILQLLQLVAAAHSSGRLLFSHPIVARRRTAPPTSSSTDVPLIARMDSSAPRHGSGGDGGSSSGWHRSGTVANRSALVIGYAQDLPDYCRRRSASAAGRPLTLGCVSSVAVDQPFVRSVCCRRKRHTGHLRPTADRKYVYNICAVARLGNLRAIAGGDGRAINAYHVDATVCDLRSYARQTAGVKDLQFKSRSFTCAQADIQRPRTGAPIVCQDDNNARRPKQPTPAQVYRVTRRFDRIDGASVDGDVNAAAAAAAADETARPKDALRRLPCLRACDRRVQGVRETAVDRFGATACQSRVTGSIF